MADSFDPGATILVVDDSRLNLRLLETLLAPLGHEVILASSGEEALAQVRHTLPDLILLDIMMPGLDGYEVARRLRAYPPTVHVPIVMVTTLREVEDRVRALEAGADDFLTKPVEKVELQARVRSLLKSKAYHDQLLAHQRRLEDQVARRTQQLREAMDKAQRVALDTILRLSQAAEFKDGDTADHISRMSNYTAVVARGLGLPSRTQEAILYASPMHDVGKIGIPDRILLKPGPLDSREWVIMRQHPIFGARILQGSDEGGFLRLAEVICLTHHERWDGQGYPHGLQGREIPLAGRIVAVCDVFDALTSKRPYKEPLPVEKALNIIRQGAGTQFDPRVVEAFLAARDDILTIREAFARMPERQPILASLLESLEN
ncbi:MAG: response regulator [Deltaproteobacteria bacterium]|nr:response regulator [Deltaproteobacteria bacterium]